MKEWFVLVNANAGNGVALRKWPSVQQLLYSASISFSHKVSQSRREGTEFIDEALSGGFRKFIAVGGDGTLNSIVNAVLQQKKNLSPEITLSLIPLGTGNDWIKTHHIPKAPEKAISIIASGNSQLHDVGILMKSNNQGSEAHYFINVTGLAFQGLVVKRIEGAGKWLKLGFAAFVLGIADALFRYKTTSFRIQLDQKELEGRFINVSIGICKYAGGGMKLTPDALPNDGWLDVTLCGDLSKMEVIRNVFRLFSGSFVKHKKVNQFRTKRISVTASPFLPVETDGEFLGYGNVQIEILPSAIRVMVP